MDLGEFYGVTRDIAYYEQQRDSATRALKELYDKLVPNCPHSESIEFRLKRSGLFRICKICAIEDRASYGGTPGDEYDYGYPGYPDKSFWGDTEVETARDEQHLWEYRRSTHDWRVHNGKAVK